jgi:hypothetical protein
MFCAIFRSSKVKDNEMAVDTTGSLTWNDIWRLIVFKCVSPVDLENSGNLLVRLCA